MVPSVALLNFPITRCNSSRKVHDQDHQVLPMLS
jgi:hypothetical protein